MPKLPAPPPARPTTSLPENRDEVNIRMFGDEFDAFPLPDENEARANAPLCDQTNMEYIRSHIPVLRYDYESFFEKMAKHTWRAALPSAGAIATGRRMVVGAQRGLANHPVAPKPSYIGTPANGWKEMADLKRVNAYAFRGDKRRVSDIRAQGGFHPPSSRTDDSYLKVIAERFVTYMKSSFGKDVSPADVVAYIKREGPAGQAFVEYDRWRAALDAEKFHIGRMVDNEFLKGYISTSRDVNVAKGFASASSADGTFAPSYAVYALHTGGGFLLPPRAVHMHGFSGNEAEIAHPGSLPWIKVMGFRTYMRIDFNDARTFYKSGVIFMRKGFQAADPRGFSQVFASLGSLAVS